MPKRYEKFQERQITISFFNLFNQFINFKKAQGISERTIFDYENTYRKFTEYYKHLEVDYVKIREKVLTFLTKYSKNAPATYNIPYSNLNALFTWAVQEKYLPENPIKSLGLRKKKDEGKIRHIEEQIIKKLLSVIDITCYSGLRDYALILLTLDTGIRPQEALLLKPSDIDYEHFKLTIRREIAKTRTTRILPLTPQTTEILNKLNSVKSPEWHNSEFLFLTCYGLQMTVPRWHKRLEDYSKKINYKITPYMLRHTFAIMFLRNGGNVFALQHEMGHVDLNTTKRYIQLADSDIRNQHNLASPVKNFVKRTTRVQKLFKQTKKG